jgi:uncharacterized protein
VTEAEAPSQPLQAPLDIGFDYTRSPGPELSRFLAGLAGRRILGVRAADGRVHVPPFEYDPVTFAPPSPADFVEVAPEGTVVTWSWLPSPLEGQPLDHAFAWALIRLDGADTAMLHAVDAPDPAAMHTGMRVRARWAPDPVGSVRDIACFEPASEGRAAEGVGEASEQTSVPILITPINLHYVHNASPGEAIYLRGLAEGRLLGQRCPQCGKVYIPTRGTCPTDGVPMAEQVELPDTGTITTFCIVNVPYPGQKLTPPYVAAAVLLDGADIAFQHLLTGADVSEVRMGLRVKAHWNTGSNSIDYFEPTGEPDAPYESYAGHL